MYFVIRFGTPAIFVVLPGSWVPVMGKITGRAPPLHEPIRKNSRRVKSSHGLSRPLFGRQSVGNLARTR